eukprot:jgi/Psemu1/27677/gm1.27677_g
MVEDALVTAIETYSNFMSLEMKEKPNHQDQIQQLDPCFKDSPSTLKDFVALHWHLSSKYAVEVEISNKNLQLEEQRRTCIFPGQLNCILNVDKTALTLGRTSTNAGSCPVMECGTPNRSLPRGCTCAQKSSWRCTAVAKSTATRDPIPLHFQVKSNVTEGNKWISKSFTDEVDKSDTSAGMGIVEFRKYFEMSIMPLFPDAQLAKVKCICFIVDSRLSWSDPALHQLMSVKGFLLIAGVPNATHATQVTETSFNPFKPAFCSNKKKLHANRRSNKQTIKISDIPAQFFGYKETASLQLQSAFEEGFAPAVNRACWEKIGIAPFTRKCLGDRNVAHEMMTLADGTIDVDADPKSVALLELEWRNQVAVQMLVDHGFNGGYTCQNTTKYKSSSRCIAAKHCCRAKIDGNINAMKETKTCALTYTKNKEAAEPIMEQCNGGFMDLKVLQLRKVFGRKLQEKSSKLNKDDMVGALMEANDDPQLVH